MKQTIQIVEEVPGLYGSVRMEEGILQQIWAVAAFRQERLLTQCGKPVEIRNRGNWNRSEEGPDFKQSILVINGMESHGDVEIHFNPQDWEVHDHHKDPNYNRVILHVCLFPNTIPHKELGTVSGKSVPTLILLPHLLQSFEEFAEEQIISKLAGIKEFEEDRKEIAQLALAQNIGFARDRWIQKLGFARKRIERLGWEAACHQWFMEVLGYRRNRIPMARIAMQCSITEWRKGVNPEKLFENENDWKLRGSRPANHPSGRLLQYAKLIRKQPAWPELLRKMEVPCMTEPRGESRKSLGLHKVRKVWREKVLRETFGGSRIDTLWTDACLPLLAVEKEVDPFATWFHWQLGDFPRHLIEQAKEYELIGEPNRATCNGILQGFLGFCLDRSN